MNLSAIKGGKMKTFLVAELSANHGGSLQIALDSISAARDSGADAIKLQTYTPDCLSLDCDLPHFKIKGTLWAEQKYYDLYKSAQMPWEWHSELFSHAKKCGLICFSSPFSARGVEFLKELNCEIFKIASFEVVDLDFVRLCAKSGKKVILSKGIATFSEIIEALSACVEGILEARGEIDSIESSGIESKNNIESSKNLREFSSPKIAALPDITLLQCTSSYPAPQEGANLSLLPKMQKELGAFVENLSGGKVSFGVGLSDHTMGVNAAICATSLGARVIEKHFILDKSIKSADAAFSIDPSEFETLAKSVRSVELLLGDGSYELNEKQKQGRAFARSLFAVNDISKGEIFSLENVKSLRPGIGLAPRYLGQILGKKAKRDIKRGMPLEMCDL